MRDLTKPQPEPNLTLYCQLGCGRVVGYVYTPIPMTQDEYRQRGAIVDQRCSECEVTHGTFKELTDRFEKELAATPDEAVKFVVKARTLSAFEAELAKEKLKKRNDIITQ